jgi:hypothetical protein
MRQRPLDEIAATAKGLFFPLYRLRLAIRTRHEQNQEGQDPSLLWTGHATQGHIVWNLRAKFWGDGGQNLPYPTDAAHH